MQHLRRFLAWLRPRLPYLNIGLAMGAYLSNEYLVQGFCQPVLWVWWVLLPGVGAFLAWPWLKRVPRLNYLLLFWQGAFALVCLYCLLFAGPHFLGLALLVGFLSYPLLLWTPLVFGMQMIGRVWRSSLPGARWVFGAGILPLLLAQGWAWGQYQRVAAAVATLPPSQRRQPESLLRVVPRTYLAERLAGQLFKYHAVAKMLFDGWRPPLHDPLVNVCLGASAATGYTAPLTVGDIYVQAAFCHCLFPSEPVKVRCACSHDPDAQTYLTWRPGAGHPEAEGYQPGPIVQPNWTRAAPSVAGYTPQNRNRTLPCPAALLNRWSGSLIFRQRGHYVENF